jgi:hypothetical protein
MGEAANVIDLLDGSRDRAQVISEATGLGVPAAVTERVLALLAAAGVLIDFPAATLRSIPAELRQQLSREVVDASLCRADTDGGAQLLARRAATAVQVWGTGRIAATIAELLTSAGIAALARPPGGGRAAAGPAVSRLRSRSASGTHRTRPASLAVPSPDLVVVVGWQPPERMLALQRSRVPHLAVSANEAIGIVGPLVRPGTTACLRCLDHTRAERDTAWPLILAQLSGRCADLPDCDATLAMSVAAQAAGQAIAFADHSPLADATANGTLELVLPSWRWRRRTWQPHPACICRAHVLGGPRPRAS